jgi:hypothetical protein
MDKNPYSNDHIPQRMVRPLDFLPAARKQMMRTKDSEIAAKGDIEALRQLITRHPERLSQRGSQYRILL